MNKKFDFITEKQAMELLGKKRTWFHVMKKRGLKYYKPKGTATVYYKEDDLISFIENGLTQLNVPTP
jgi:hypothetical protein